MTYKCHPAHEELLEIGQEILESKSPALENSKELILEVLRLVLEHDCAAGKNGCLPSSEKITLFEGRLYDRIAAVICQTSLGPNEKASLANEDALEIIRELLLDFDELILLRNRHRTLNHWRIKRRW
jgi:hypothetical protein